MKSNKTGAVTALGALVLSCAAHAQQPDRGGALETVTVTAEKIETNLQQTPIAITEVSGADLDQQGVSDLQTALTMVPSVQVQQSNTGAVFFIRGVGQRLSSDSSSVAVYEDGVLLTQSDVTNGAFADLNRLEVLRGPQGTLYGRGADGGSVNIVTNDPVLNQLQGAASLQLGNYATVRSEAMGNIPITDDLAIRAVFSSTNHEGYLSNGTDDSDQKLGRLKLLYHPSDDFRALLSVEVQNQGGLGPDNVIVPFTDSRNPWESPAYSSINPSCAPSCNPYWHLTNTNVHAQFDWTLPFADLTFIPAYEHMSRTYAQPFSGLWEIHSTPYKQLSNELRLTSLPGSKIQWIAGLYYLYDDNDGDAKFTWFPPGFDSVTYLTKYISESKAAFGQATYPITDDIRLIAGGRYTLDRVSNFATVGGVPQGDYTGADKFNYKAGLEGDLSAHSMLYGQVSSGYKEGGWDTLTFQPETITAYEVGSKNRFFNDRAQINVAGFYYSYRNYQISYEYDTGGGTFATTTGNVGGVTTVDGIEVESSWKLTDADRVDANVSVEQGHFGSGAQFYMQCFVSATNCTADLDGRAIPRAPAWSGSVAYQHYWELANGAAITARMGTQFSGRYLTDYSPGLPEQSAYVLGNARLTYDAAGAKWSVSAYLNNLADTGVITQSNFSGPNPYGYGVLNNPRTFGVIGSARF